ncbi:MAG TPA: M24 family metallopeptidase [Polyangiaceae bacterium]|nr:M24 family metallopeptidase [Polyangiaceae bacterium]
MSLLNQIFRPLTPQDALELEPEHLAGFKRSQRIAYDCVTQVEQELRAGMTERDAAHRMEEVLRGHGVREYFHRAFAWFGDRTEFARFRTNFDFFPTRRRLEPGMPVILDVAPVVDGHAADIGYACKLGESALHDQMLLDLEPYRQLIIEGVLARRNMTDIYQDVNRLIEAQGYQNRHQRYPYRVLAHRVNYLPPRERTALTVAGFGAPALRYLLGRVARAKRGAEHHSPFWNDASPAARPADPGIWAVEPHLGFRGVGVKWEELLVVTETGAYWLDDDLPHVRRFERLRAAQVSGARTPAQHSPELRP